MYHGQHSDDAGHGTYILSLIISLGFDPIWFGVIVTMMVEIGAITPPVGMCVFAIHGIVKDVPMYTIFRALCLSDNGSRTNCYCLSVPADSHDFTKYYVLH